MVYFSRNFKLKPVLHNYPDLFKRKPRVDRSGPMANKRPVLYLVAEKMSETSFFTCPNQGEAGGCASKAVETVSIFSANKVTSCTITEGKKDNESCKGSRESHALTLSACGCLEHFQVLLST